MSPTTPDPESVAGTVFDEADDDAARSYADALIGAAGPEAREVVDELDEVIADVIRGEPKFAAMMASGSVPPAEKDRILAELFEGRARATVARFLRVLARHGRFGLLEPIVSRARATIDKRDGRKSVTVTSAVPLDDAQRDALTSRLASLVGASPQIKLAVDPGLIAGLIVQVGDDVYDASARTRLRRLRDRLTERKHHEQVQGG